MIEDRPAIVVTTIFEVGEALKCLSTGAIEKNWDLIIIGDRKSPKNFHLTGADFFDLEAQHQTGFKLSKLCPESHYARKNLGYLIAMKSGNTVIIETDDDNIPKADFWLARTRSKKAVSVSGDGWYNIYNQFSGDLIWPRGFPLEHIHSTNHTSIDMKLIESQYPIQQGLADENPDVDAVFRMTRELPINFNNVDHSVVLKGGVWCPFNSQNTTWFKEAFPLLYLPSYCTFRMTDIWRSFVAQRIAWECGWEVLYHQATVFQRRNDHNLLKDFELEIPGYLHNDRIAQVLQSLPLKSGVKNIADNMVACYGELVAKKIIDNPHELVLLNAWLDDL